MQNIYSIVLSKISLYDNYSKCPRKINISLCDKHRDLSILWKQQMFILKFTNHVLENVSEKTRKRLESSGRDETLKTRTSNETSLFIYRRKVSRFPSQGGEREREKHS